jgi:hypothetical protein
MNSDGYVEGPVWWHGSQVLYRLALATAARGRRMAEQQQRADVDQRERHFREIDAGMTVVILVQAAIESYANFVYRTQTQPAPAGGWIARWQGFTAVAVARGVTEDPTLPPHHAETLAEVNSWRNYLVHGDERARDRLRQHLRAAGEDIR